MQTLARKSALLFIAAMCSLTALVLVTARYAFVDSFTRIETREALSATRQAQALLLASRDAMHRQCADWAAWDDSYEFVTRRDTDFVERNVTLQAFSDNDVDLMAFYDAQGQPILVRMRGADNSYFRDPPKDLTDALAPQGELGRKLANDAPFAGLLSLYEGPLFVSARPITRSTDPTRRGGWLVWGRYALGALPPFFSDLLPHAAQLFTPGSYDTPPQVAALFTSAAKRDPQVRPLDDSTMEGLAVLTDIKGDPGLAMRILMPREASEQGNKALMLFSLVILVGTALVAATAQVLFQKHVGRRAASLAADIERVRISGFRSPLPADGDDEIAAIGHAINRLIRDREQAAHTLQENEAFFRLLYEQAPDAMLLLLDESIASANDAAARLLGVADRKDLLSHPLIEFFPPAQEGGIPSVEGFARQVENTTPLGNRRFEWIFMRSGGSEVPCEVTLSPVMQRGRRMLHLTARDISERKRNEAQITHLAFHDSLTGLANRVLFLDRLAHAIATCRRAPDRNFAVLFIDLDRFKVINDSLGHAAGDGLLSIIASAIAANIRETDTVARISGDEFTVLVHEPPSPRFAIKMARRILERIKQPLTIEGFELVISASMGIVIGNSGYTDPHQVLRDADIAMYKAKRAGKDKLRVFGSRMHEQALHAMRLENDLRQAIDNGDLSCHYQPIVNLESGALEGFEALARWQHPTLGNIPPSTFIPIAEDTGRIIPLGRAMLHKACAFAASIRGTLPQGDPVIHVNLSPRQFLSRQLLREVEAALDATGLPPELLVLEITESLLMENPRVAKSIMAGLKEIGVRLSLDDFGTGYSSLGSLQDYPLDSVKIDRSFIRAMNDGRDAEHIVRAILKLVSHLRLEAICEGVETTMQAANLMAFGATRMQGFLFAKPMPSEKARSLLERLALGERFTLTGMGS
ncbi:bifunctional diguanylate cyclase/phosphodiesterase [Nitratidesulfovibrio vulgaris]|jgi:Amt family ammonium transporter|uniref:bifunctional diguanylate cyclase/phosphodiesterase n=1 Tax=Nitratidesulfovibrio vulgaris TaxID=881 RepID=UPI0013DF2DA7|nr:EAL domain-containing protein [Nitratidesulfovibrio vulgaris]WCB46132.1 EAL domain-containing protein [Nitratidesulfovibrio vulgaris]